jgi:hypothetical protein
MVAVGELETSKRLAEVGDTSAVGYVRFSRG